MITAPCELNYMIESGRIHIKVTGMVNTYLVYVWTPGVGWQLMQSDADQDEETKAETPAPVEESGPRKCTCSMAVILASGCKCGGV